MSREMVLGGIGHASHPLEVPDTRKDTVARTGGGIGQMEKPATSIKRSLRPRMVVQTRWSRITAQANTPCEQDP